MDGYVNMTATPSMDEKKPVETVAEMENEEGDVSPTA